MQNWREYKKVLLPDIPNYNEIDVYTQHGGYEMLRQVMTSSDWNRKKVIDEVKAANIRGRGGAGFNAGLKWSFMPPKKPGGTTLPRLQRGRIGAWHLQGPQVVRIQPPPIHRRRHHCLLRDGNGCRLCLYPW